MLISFSFLSLEIYIFLLSMYQICSENNANVSTFGDRKTDHVPSTMARVGAEPVYTSQDEPREKFVVYFENPKGLGEGVTDLHDTIT